jgi:dolichol-phosphate mannosyltransferase
MTANKEQNFISAVLYVRNNAAIVKNALNIMINTLNENFNKFEVICVNDSSTDDSLEIIKQVAKETGASVTAISTGYFQGLESSMSAGVDSAIGDFVLEFDNSVFALEPSAIMRVYHRCLQGYDIVSASSGSMRGTSKLFYSWFNKSSGTNYPLASEDFRIISRRAINRIRQMSHTITYRKVLYANCGLKYDNIKYTIDKNFSLDDYKTINKTFRRKLAIDSFIMYTDIAYKISFGLSIFMMFLTFLGLIYTIVIYISGIALLGWTTTMLLLSGGLFGIFSILTFIVKYLSLILNLVLEKRKYVIGNIEKL